MVKSQCRERQASRGSAACGPALGVNRHVRELCKADTKTARSHSQGRPPRPLCVTSKVDVNEVGAVKQQEGKKKKKNTLLRRHSATHCCLGSENLCIDGADERKRRSFFHMFISRSPRDKQPSLSSSLARSRPSRQRL